MTDRPAQDALDAEIMRRRTEDAADAARWRYHQENAKWYDNHENLHTLAEWLREQHGWQFCKDNLLDVLEKPWKWEKEWKLASGGVNFIMIDDTHRGEHDPVPPGTICEWCGFEILDLVSCVDTLTGEWAHVDCAGLASNFVETTTAHMRATDAARIQAMESPLFPNLIVVKDDMPGHPHNPAVFPLAWEPQS